MSKIRRAGKLSFQIMPHANAPEFKKLMQVSGDMFPGKKLNYIGSNDLGHHMACDDGSAPCVIPHNKIK